MCASHRLFYLVAFLIHNVFLSGCASVAPIPVIHTHYDENFTLKNKKFPPFTLQTILFSLEKGQDIGARGSGLLCVPYENLLWDREDVLFNKSDFIKEIHRLFTENSLVLYGSKQVLFEEIDHTPTDLYIGAEITEVRSNICTPFGYFRNRAVHTGDAYMKVKWSVYSKKAKTVIYTLFTEGTTHASYSEKNAYRLIKDSFQNATLELLYHPSFYHEMSKNIP